MTRCRNKYAKIVTSGPSDPVRIVTSGPSDPVEFVTDGTADRVRIVTSGPSDPVRIVGGGPPPLPTPTAPVLAGAEIGIINSSTIIITFDQPVTITGGICSSGWTVNVNGGWYGIASCSFTDSTHLELVLTIPIVNGDVVSVYYDASSGFLVGVTGGLPMADVSGQSVTNNVSYFPSLIFSDYRNSMYLQVL